MSGAYSGVQARIREKEPTTDYVHCAAHNLNLALNDSVKNVPELRNFYDAVENLYIFFGHSIKRWHILKEISLISDNISATLKRLSPTRWSSRHDSLAALRFRYVNILKGLTKIILLTKSSEEKTQASSMRSQLESFEFVFLTIFQCEFLQIINGVSILLQRSDMQLDNTVSLLETAMNKLINLRNSFDELRNKAKEIAIKWGISPTFSEKRRKKTKKFFDELCEDERLAVSEDILK